MAKHARVPAQPPPPPPSISPPKLLSVLRPAPPPQQQTSQLLCPRPQTTGVSCTCCGKKQPQQQASSYGTSYAAPGSSTGRSSSRQPSKARPGDSSGRPETKPIKLTLKNQIKSCDRFRRLRWAALDDADLVGDLECVKVLGETYVRLLLAVRPAGNTHTHTFTTQTGRETRFWENRSDIG